MILFVVPAFNEEANIGPLIGAVDAWAKRAERRYRLIVVDDGSTDGTAAAVRDGSADFPCELISYYPNRGVAEAFRQGFERALALAKEDDLLVTLEADLTADITILQRLIRSIEDGCDAAVASYYAKGGGLKGTPWHRRLLSRAANHLTRALFPIQGIHTYSSFFRVYRPAALKRVREAYGDFFEEKGFACVVELLIRLHRLGLRLGEVPMVLQSSRRIGKSKMKILPTVLGYLRISKRRVLKNI